MKYLIVLIIFLYGCASKHPSCWGLQTILDGKATASCERGVIAEDYCNKKPFNYDYYGVTCLSPCEITDNHPDCKKAK